MSAGSRHCLQLLQVRSALVPSALRRPALTQTMIHAGQLITAGTDQVVREWKAFEIREEVTEMEVCDEVVALAAMEDGMVLVLGQRSGEMPIALRLGSQASACRR